MDRSTDGKSVTRTYEAGDEGVQYVAFDGNSPCCYLVRSDGLVDRVRGTDEVITLDPMAPQVEKKSCVIC